MDTKHLAHSGQIFTDNKDKNILITIKASALIERDFQIIKPESSLGELVELIANSKRNIFPVTDENGCLLGIVLLDNVREYIFKSNLYDSIHIRDIMTQAPGYISSSENMDSVMKKFDQTGAWNLPVVDNNIYQGFISKSTVFNRYREKLITSTL